MLQERRTREETAAGEAAGEVGAPAAEAVQQGVGRGARAERAAVAGEEGGKRGEAAMEEAEERERGGLRRGEHSRGRAVGVPRGGRIPGD